MNMMLDEAHTELMHDLTIEPATELASEEYVTKHTPTYSSNITSNSASLQKTNTRTKKKIACVAAPLLGALTIFATTVEFTEYVQGVNITPPASGIELSLLSTGSTGEGNESELVDIQSELYEQYEYAWSRHLRLARLEQSININDNLFDYSIPVERYYIQRFEDFISNREAIISQMEAQQESETLARRNVQTLRNNTLASLREAEYLLEQQDILLASIANRVNMFSNPNLTPLDIIRILEDSNLNVGPFTRFLPENINTQNYREVLERLAQSIAGAEEILEQQTRYLQESNAQLRRRIDEMRNVIASLDHQLASSTQIIVDRALISEQMRLEELIIVNSAQSITRQTLDALQLELAYIATRIDESQAVNDIQVIGNGIYGASPLLIMINARDWDCVAIGQNIEASLPTASGYVEIQGRVINRVVDILPGQNMPTFIAEAMLYNNHFELLPEIASDIRIITNNRTLFGRLLGGN